MIFKFICLLSLGIYYPRRKDVLVIKKRYIQIAVSIFAIGLVALSGVIETSATLSMNGFWDPLNSRAISNPDFSETSDNLYSAPGWDVYGSGYAYYYSSQYQSAPLSARLKRTDNGALTLKQTLSTDTVNRAKGKNLCFSFSYRPYGSSDIDDKARAVIGYKYKVYDREFHQWFYYSIEYPCDWAVPKGTDWVSVETKAISIHTGAYEMWVKIIVDDPNSSGDTHSLVDDAKLVIYQRIHHVESLYYNGNYYQVEDSLTMTIDRVQDAPYGDDVMYFSVAASSRTIDGVFLLEAVRIEVQMLPSNMDGTLSVLDIMSENSENVEIKPAGTGSPDLEWLPLAATLGVEAFGEIVDDIAFTTVGAATGSFALGMLLAVGTWLVFDYMYEQYEEATQDILFANGGGGAGSHTRVTWDTAMGLDTPERVTGINNFAWVYNDDYSNYGLAITATFYYSFYGTGYGFQSTSITNYLYV